MQTVCAYLIFSVNKFVWGKNRAEIILDHQWKKCSSNIWYGIIAMCTCNPGQWWFNVNICAFLGSQQQYLLHKNLMSVCHHFRVIYYGRNKVMLCYVVQKHGHTHIHIQKHEGSQLKLARTPETEATHTTTTTTHSVGIVFVLLIVRFFALLNA